MFFFDAELADVAVVELHGAGDVAVDAAGGEDAGGGAGGGVVFVAEGLHDGWGLVDVVERGGADVLGGGEAQGVDNFEVVPGTESGEPSASSHTHSHNQNEVVE